MLLKCHLKVNTITHIIIHKMCPNTNIYFLTATSLSLPLCVTLYCTSYAHTVSFIFSRTQSLNSSSNQSKFFRNSVIYEKNGQGLMTDLLLFFLENLDLNYGTCFFFLVLLIYKKFGEDITG
jgi:hypothetical protein